MKIGIPVTQFFSQANKRYQVLMTPWKLFIKDEHNLFDIHFNRDCYRDFEHMGKVAMKVCEVLNAEHEKQE